MLVLALFSLFFTFFLLVLNLMYYFTRKTQYIRNELEMSVQQQYNKANVDLFDSMQANQECELPYSDQY